VVRAGELARGQDRGREVNRFDNREDAGRRLSERLRGGLPATVVVGAVPRGGLPVARPIADRLHAPLALVPVRKMTSVLVPDLAFGAVDADGEAIVDPQVVKGLQVSPGEREAERIRVRGELRHALTRYEVFDPGIAFAGRVVVLVDDGCRTGLTMAAAILYARRHGAAEVIAATACAHPSALARLEPRADRVVSLVTDPGFVAVARYFREFAPVDDAEVAANLRGPAESLPA
jgi:putative phosphoribosyl transferase